MSEYLSSVPPPPPPPPAPPQPRRRHRVWPWLLAVVLILMLVGSLALNFLLSVAVALGADGTGGLREETISGDAMQEDKVAIVSLRGVIIDAGDSLFGVNPFSFAMEQLHQAGQDEQVKAIVLEIDSPGGAVTASDELYHRISELRRNTGKPVVVSMAGVAASGGYYVSIAGDYIVAQPTTITGSIGVIMNLVNVEGLAEKVGLESVVIKSGEFKDVGSAFRQMTVEEREMLQGMIDTLFTRFKSLVAERRGITPGRLDALTDGRVFTAESALSAGLIDEIGYFEDAVAHAKRVAGVPDAKVVRYHKVVGLRSLLGAHLGLAGSSHTITINVSGVSVPPSARFLYMWVVGSGQVSAGDL